MVLLLEAAPVPLQLPRVPLVVHVQVMLEHPAWRESEWCHPLEWGGYSQLVQH